MARELAPEGGRRGGLRWFKRADWTAIWTAVLAAATIILTFYTALLFYEAAHSSREQSEATQKQLIASSRAWVTPFDSAFSEKPAIGTPVTFILHLANTGREPATDVASTVSPFEAVGDDTDVGSMFYRITSSAEQCMKSATTGNRIVYPAIGLGAGNQDQRFPVGPLSSSVFLGRSALIIPGCLAYRTAGQLHHSAYCFYYRPGDTPDFQHLNFCVTGQRAD